MRPTRPLSAFLLGTLVPLLGSVASGAPDEHPPYRVAFIGPLTGPLAASGAEGLAGVSAAVAHRSAHGGVGGRRIEVIPLDDLDSVAGAQKAWSAALAAKSDAIVAASTGRTVDTLVAKARNTKVPFLPLLLVGSAGPHVVTLSPSDGVLFVGSSPVDQALYLANTLVLPCPSHAPAVVVEDTPRGDELRAALARNLGTTRKLSGVVRVPPGGAPTADELQGLRTAGADRLVVLGEPDLLDATAAACARAAWDVPLLAGEGLLSHGAPAVVDGGAKRVHYVVGSPQLTLDGPPRALEELLEKDPKAPRPVLPRTVAAWTATVALLESAEPKGSKPAKVAEVIAALRDRRYGPEESKTPFFDQLGRASLYRFTVWTQGEKGPEAVEASLVPAEGFGPLMGLRTPASYAVEPGTKVVWVTFGDEKSKAPRTIEKDLAELGLGTRGYEGSLDDKVRDELMARVLGKLNRLFLKNEDGTFIPGVSFAVSFTDKRPEGAKPTDVWTAVIAGDDKEAGGRAWPGEGRCEIYSVFLRRTIFQPNALTPRLDHDDLGAVNATQPWKGVKLEHLRADQIRCLIDGYAGSMALTGAHELGHVAGLGHDETDPRSIMNVAEGAGLRETQAFFIPAHAAIIERAVGRWHEPKK